MALEMLLPRVTRDISDGLLVLDLSGCISFVNPAAKRLLGVDDISAGEKYVGIMMKDGGKNDSFHQMLLDAVYDKNILHKTELRYVRPDGTERIFRVSSSFLFGENGEEKEGVVIQFSDVTEETVSREKHHDAAVMLVILITFVSLCVLNYAVWDSLGRPIDQSILTKIAEIVGFVAAAAIMRHTGIKYEDMGLRIKGAGKYIRKDFMITAVIMAVIIGGKFLCRIFLPKLVSPDAPFFYWYAAEIYDYIYPITVVAQEFLTRGLMHESIARIIPGKHAEGVAIIVSSLFFSAVHIHMGLPYMIGSFVLLSVFGMVYCKQRTIWGLCIPHFFLGESLKFLFGVI